MNESRSLEAAVASGVLASEEQHRALLQSIVEVARAIFNAKASSVFLLDEEAEELVFEAVAGEGAGTLVGRRMPSSAGFAGWVLVTRQPIVVEDVSEDPRHARGFAQETGYVPQGLMAVPLLHEDRALGVLQVLDRPQNAQFSLQEMDLLSLFANQAAIALELLQRARRARTVLYEEGREDLEAVSGLAAALDELEGADREAALRLLQALEDLLRR
jgi:GAF domain-containing protein